MTSLLWKRYIQVFGNTETVRIITYCSTFVTLVFTIFFLVMFIAMFVFDYDPWQQERRRVHPDETEIRDWIRSVHGTIESRLDPERHITRVRLNNCHITDDDLIRLVPLSRMKELDLSNTDITDEAIPTILSMESLFYLTINDTKMTREGVKRMYKEREMSIEVTFREVQPDESE